MLALHRVVRLPEVNVEVIPNNIIIQKSSQLVISFMQIFIFIY